MLCMCQSLCIMYISLTKCRDTLYHARIIEKKYLLNLICYSVIHVATYKRRDKLIYNYIENTVQYFAFKCTTTYSCRQKGKSIQLSSVTVLLTIFVPYTLLLQQYPVFN